MVQFVFVPSNTVPSLSSPIIVNVTSPSGRAFDTFFLLNLNIAYVWPLNLSKFSQSPS